METAISLYKISYNDERRWMSFFIETSPRASYRIFYYLFSTFYLLQSFKKHNVYLFILCTIKNLAYLQQLIID